MAMVASVLLFYDDNGRFCTPVLRWQWSLLYSCFTMKSQVFGGCNCLPRMSMNNFPTVSITEKECRVGWCEIQGADDKLGQTCMSYQKRHNSYESECIDFKFCTLCPCNACILSHSMNPPQSPRHVQFGCGTACRHWPPWPCPGRTSPR